MRIIIVDDHDIFRQSLAMLLNHAADHEVLAHYGSISQLLAHREQVDPDCVILDYHMSGEAPLLAISTIAKRWPSAFIVFLTGTRSIAIVKRITESPVHGVFHKHDSAECILAKLSELVPGERVISPGIAQQIESLEFGFTNKEFDVLLLLTQGQTPSQIADRLCVSKRTIEKHKENMMRKAELTNMAQLIDLGHRLALIE